MACHMSQNSTRLRKRTFLVSFFTTILMIWFTVFIFKLLAMSLNSKQMLPGNSVLNTSISSSLTNIFIPINEEIKSHNVTRRVSIVIWVKLNGVLSLNDFARIFRFRCHKAKGIPFPSLFPNDLYPMAKVKRKIVDSSRMVTLPNETGCLSSCQGTQRTPSLF